MASDVVSSSTVAYVYLLYSSFQILSACYRMFHSEPCVADSSSMGPEQRRPKPSSACNSLQHDGRVKEGREVFALSSVNYTFLIEVLLCKVKGTDEF